MRSALILIAVLWTAVLGVPVSYDPDPKFPYEAPDVGARYAKRTGVDLTDLPANQIRYLASTYQTLRHNTTTIPGSPQDPAGENSSYAFISELTKDAPQLLDLLSKHPAKPPSERVVQAARNNLLRRFQAAVNKRRANIQRRTERAAKNRETGRRSSGRKTTTMTEGRIERNGGNGENGVEFDSRPAVETERNGNGNGNGSGNGNGNGNGNGKNAARRPKSKSATETKSNGKSEAEPNPKPLIETKRNSNDDINGNAKKSTSKNLKSEPVAGTQRDPPSSTHRTESPLFVGTSPFARQAGRITGGQLLNDAARQMPYLGGAVAGGMVGLFDALRRANLALY